MIGADRATPAECGTPPTINDPELFRRVVPSLGRAVGVENALEIDPTLGGEEFAGPRSTRKGRKEKRAPAQRERPKLAPYTRCIRSYELGGEIEFSSGARISGRL